MLGRLTGINRRFAIAGLVLFASALLLVAGLVSIFAALNDDNVDLPSEGSLEEILKEHEPAQTGGEMPVEEAAGPPPIRISIPRIEVDAPITAMGLDSRSYPEVPTTGGDVAWYTFSAAPGRGSNAVFSGHVDWYYWGKPGEGVFYHLRELQIGDENRSSTLGSLLDQANTIGATKQELVDIVRALDSAGLIEAEVRTR